MKIKNISAKPICIGNVDTLPGSTYTVADEYKDAVELYVALGMVSVVAEKEKAVRGGKKSEKTDADATPEAAAL